MCFTCGLQEKHEDAVANFPRPILPKADLTRLAVATNGLVTCGGTAVGTIEAHVQCTGDESAAAVACRGDGLKYQGVCESPATQASLYERGLASRRSRELGLLVREIVQERKLTALRVTGRRGVILEFAAVNDSSIHLLW